MSGQTKTTIYFSGQSARGAWRERWQVVRDLLGGVLILAVWLALWTSVWAAVAGPLSPARAERPAAERALAD